MTEHGSMDKGDRQAMMGSIMEQFFAGVDADEKKEMCSAMMGMMSGGAGNSPGAMQDKMSKMMSGGPEQHMSQMPEVMLKSMMPHCIGMMLPAIEADKRGEAAVGILSAIVEKGTVGMSDDQRQSFHKALEDVLSPSA